MRVVAITQARRTSTRLPGKDLLEAAGKPLLQHHLERAARARRIDQLVVATTTTTNDDDLPIVALADRLGVPVWRGPENDVLARYIGAARAHDADIIVRITSDCPMLDPALIDRVAEPCIAGQFDYVVNCIPHTYPLGMSAEACTRAALEQAFRDATTVPEREHVTYHLECHPELFRFVNLTYHEDRSGLRLTVDYPQDYEVVRRFIEMLPEHYTLADVLAVADRHPEITAINASCRQKVL